MQRGFLAKRVIFLAKGKKQKEHASDLNDPNDSNSKADDKRKTGYNRVKLSERSIG